MKMEWNHGQTNCCKSHQSESGELSSTWDTMILLAVLQIFKGENKQINYLTRPSLK